MALSAVLASQGGSIGDLLVTLARVEGSAAHAYAGSPALLSGPVAARNLADAVHLICVLHGRHPGVIDIAADRSMPGTTGLLDLAAFHFAEERAYLTRLVVAAGPLPSTPGQAESEATVQGQRHALEMLAHSDRTGCSLGTAIALLLDWPAIRDVLDTAAHRFGIDVPPLGLPDAGEIAAQIPELLAGAERAVSFGAQQLLVQHRGLWDLLEAREVARRDH